MQVLFLFFWMRRRAKVLGFTWNTCARCGHYTPQVLVETVDWWAVGFFFRVLPFSFNRFVVCNQCGVKSRPVSRAELDQIYHNATVVPV